MYEEHLFINESSPVVLRSNLKPVWIGSKVHLGQVVFQFRAIGVTILSGRRNLYRNQALHSWDICWLNLCCTICGKALVNCTAAGNKVFV